MKPTRQPVLVSAPGKSIIFGEHAVVHGKTAIAASVGLRTFALFNPVHDGAITLEFSDIQFRQSWGESDLREAKSELAKTGVDAATPVPIPDSVRAKLHPLLNVDPASAQGRAAMSFLYLFLSISDDITGIDVSVRSRLPVGAGLGSSASFSACIASGLLSLYGHVADTRPHAGDGVGTCSDAGEATDDGHTKGTNGTTPASWTVNEVDLINEWSFMAEKIIHGNPSGIDNSVCVHGGAILYTRGKPLEQLVGFTSLRFLVTNSNVPKDTLVMVANVSKLLATHPTIFTHVIDAIQGVSTTCKEAVGLYEASGKSKDDRARLYDTIGLLIDTNQTLLVSLGVSHPALENIRAIGKRHGLVTKLTGGGGGGCAVSVARDDLNPDDLATVISELKGAGYDPFLTSVGCPGVCLHDISRASGVLGESVPPSGLNGRFLSADLPALQSCCTNEVL